MRLERQERLGLSSMRVVGWLEDWSARERQSRRSADEVTLVRSWTALGSKFKYGFMFGEEGFKSSLG